MLLRSQLFILVFTITLLGCNPAKQSDTVQSSTVETDNDLDMMEKDLSSDSLNNELRTLLATNYYSKGELDKAAYHFLKVYKQSEKDFVALSNLGNIYYDNHQDAKAIEFYEKALLVEPQNINLRCDLATCYSNTGNYDRAIQILKENIKINARHEKSHHNLSVILLKNGDSAGSEKEKKIYEELMAGPH